MGRTEDFLIREVEKKKGTYGKNIFLEKKCAVREQMREMMVSDSGCLGLVSRLMSGDKSQSSLIAPRKETVPLRGSAFSQIRDFRNSDAFS